MLSNVKASGFQPIVPIGGINKENSGDVVEADSKSVFVVRSVFLGDVPEDVTQLLVEAVPNAM